MIKYKDSGKKAVVLSEFCLGIVDDSGLDGHII